MGKHLCTDCDLCRMGIGNNPQCLKGRISVKEHEKITECSTYIHHLCRSCANMSGCKYVYATGNKNVKNYPFIKEVMPTSRGGTIITRCDNYKYIENKPRGKAKAVQKLCNDFIETFHEGARGQSKKDFI